MMRFIAVAALKDVRRRLADPAALVIWIGIPVMLGGMMSLLSGDNAAPRARVLLVDQDDSLATQFLRRAGGSSSPIDIEVVTLAEGQQRIDRGDATAMLIVPKGFQTALLNDTPAALTLVKNPAQRVLPSVVEESLKTLVEADFYAQQLVGVAVRRTVDASSSPGSNEGIAAISVAVGERVRRLRSTLLPPVLDVDIRNEEPQAERLDFGQLFLPGILFMSFMFIAQGMSSDVWDEKTAGTLRRALALPQSPYALLAGKLAAGLVFNVVIGVAAMAAAMIFFHVSWTRVPLALAWCTFVGVALLALMTLLQTLAGSERGANMLGTMITFPFMMLGGSFFPFEAMPAWMASVGRWTPNGLGVMELKTILYGSPTLGTLGAAALGIGVPAVLAFVLACRRLRGSFAAA